ncbi:peptidase associated/transthyretin-like domain-containing protein [Mucilaginibacter boryungensis]|uniref:Carboxypeptidase-like protein n=1 Tax=Mucilaginibacter boryungensis TaxID=768480 RepID=A0ABR9XKD1_9SPHI|nr:hypothetical protein [Mucilaginibacter boryungensis]MBE9667665.1 hypothetical protein [Mucilaginibacter boryungensis]
MKTKYFVFIILFFAIRPLHAQILKGSVVELGKNQRISNVFIRDMNSKSVALSDKKGNFDISTEPGHTLIFSSPGYVSDTLYVTDMKYKRVEMVVQGIALREVNISATRTTFNPRVEYADVYRKSKVYPMSPSTWFSREGRNARRLKRYFEREEQERHIDSVFNRVYVSSIVPLRGQELEDFMTLYRPTYAYIMNNNGPSLAAYINDSYKKWKALPPGKRKTQRLY